MLWLRWRTACLCGAWQGRGLGRRNGLRRRRPGGPGSGCRGSAARIFPLPTLLSLALRCSCPLVGSPRGFTGSHPLVLDDGVRKRFGCPARESAKADEFACLADAVEFDGIAVVVEAPVSPVPALREVEGLVDAAGDLELLFGVGGLHRLLPVRGRRGGGSRVSRPCGSGRRRDARRWPVRGPGFPGRCARSGRSIR